VNSYDETEDRHFCIQQRAGLILKSQWRILACTLAGRSNASRWAASVRGRGLKADFIDVRAHSSSIDTHKFIANVSM